MRRLISILIAIALMIPTVIIAPLHAQTDPYFQKYVSYDAEHNVFIDKSMTVDNWCRFAREPMPSGRRCSEGFLVPAILLVIPQSSASAGCARESVSATMRTNRKPIASKTQLANIAEAAADAMTSPTAFTRLGLSFNRCGRGVGVFSSDAVKCDALGWILKKSCDELALNHKRRHLAYRVSEILNDEVIKVTGRSIVAISDEDGRTAISKVLREVAKRFRET